MTDREITDLVATKVMGWKLSEEHGECWWDLPNKKNRQRRPTGSWEAGCPTCCNWSPLTNANHCDEAIEAMHKDGYDYEERRSYPHAFSYVRFHRLEDGKWYGVHDNSRLRAACLAMLRSKGVSV